MELELRTNVTERRPCWPGPAARAAARRVERALGLVLRLALLAVLVGISA